MPYCEPSRPAPGTADTARSLQKVPNGAWSDPSLEHGVTEQSWQEKPAWNPKPKPTSSHIFPLVTCLNCVKLNIFFYLPQDSQVFLLLSWKKQVSILVACGIQAHDDPNTPCTKDKRRNHVLEGLLHISLHIQPGWWSRSVPPELFILGCPMVLVPQYLGWQLPSLLQTDGLKARMGFVAWKKKEAPTRSGVRTHAGMRPLDLKSNAFTTRPSWWAACCPLASQVLSSRTLTSPSHQSPNSRLFLGSATSSSPHHFL